MKLVNYTYDQSSNLVRKDITISGKNLEFVKQGVKAIMRAACIKNKISEYKAANPQISSDKKSLSKLVSEHPELSQLENWQVLAIDDYVERMFT